MVCPFCTNKQTSVYNSRPTTKLNNVWRRRRCDKCHKTFTTTEQVDPSSVIKVKQGKKTVPFLETKLLISVLQACDHLERPAESAYYITHTVTQNLYRRAATQLQTVLIADIIEAALTALKPYNLSAYVKYLSYHAPQIDERMLKKRLKGSTS